MKLNQAPDVILNLFDELLATTSMNPTTEQVKSFVLEHFSPPGSELINWTPTDWKANPTFLQSIADPGLRLWARDLHDLWKVLGREMIDDVATNPTLYSLIAVEHPVIVPGGRFRELYYWDTYWVIRGLLISDMASTVRDILQNLLGFVETYGFVPNGARNYYSRRSHPPFLIAMVKEYYDTTADKQFIEDNLATLEKEYSFWMSQRNVTVDGHLLNRYASSVDQPRPESYREDKAFIKELPQKEGEELMKHITSACESGWDFSSRWAGPSYDSQNHVIGQLATRDVVPVDLNSLLSLCERSMSEFYQLIGNDAKSALFNDRYKARVEAIESVLWNEEKGSYFDYIVSTKQHHRKYYASNFNPLWTKCFPSSVNRTDREARMHTYLLANGILSYPGGIPTSLENSGEQWDFPNAWPPLVHMIIEGLATSDFPELQDEAFIQAEKWIHGNYKAYVKTGAMFEKYDVTESEGVPGSGGEYDVQTGFGWTNGVVLSFLDRYGSSLTT
uniref:Trehalase n=1 Tax=Phallusia mammillata TaxID=59560 RepID=A0A6F9DUX5_9ASCI|nr:trehalase-like [Phallusia mammillata]